MIFQQRAKCIAIPTGRERRWMSTDGRWAIIEIRSDDRPKQRRYLLARQARAGEYLVARCRTRQAAEQLAAKRAASESPKATSRLLAS
jgi:hypothetical protein